MRGSKPKLISPKSETLASTSPFSNPVNQSSRPSPESSIAAYLLQSVVSLVIPCLLVIGFLGIHHRTEPSSTNCRPQLRRPASPSCVVRFCVISASPSCVTVVCLKLCVATHQL
ncbi:hypothetical protein PIB30_054626 [Stylosanthes scabra]|uniref:Uncharacterized protein n=1 Tax=Stylosanthes scabra TaxID=79078 RepID=A0ABU6UHL6_9FABA|nr:hypothetical protein [Stylosanthes scabra]